MKIKRNTPEEMNDLLSLAVDYSKISKKSTKDKILVDNEEVEDENRTVDRTKQRTFERSNERNNEETNIIPNEDSNVSIIEETKKPINKRITKRYSFEIFDDQIERIEKIRMKYRKKTSKKLTISRVIQESLDNYLKLLEELI